MKRYDYDTNNLWNLFLLLTKVLLFIVICSISYLVLKDHLTLDTDKPRYSKDQLDAFTRKRDKQRLQEQNDSWDLVKNGVHVKTGLQDDPNLKVIIASCLSCHSSKLIIQNRATREGWHNMISWMQETQGLGDLGSNERIVLDYLEKHYAPEEEGRRTNLDMAAIEWYILEIDSE